MFNFNDSREIVWWVYWVGYTLICFFIACGTYIRRPSERAGQPSTDRPIYRLISVVVSIVCGLVGSKMFSAIWDSVLASAIGFFLLSFLGHVAAELIVSRGSSGLLRSMKYYLIAIVITAAGLLILMFDVGGFARYAPTLDDVQAVVITNRQLAEYYGSFDGRRPPLLLEADKDREDIDAILTLQNSLTKQGKSERCVLPAGWCCTSYQANYIYEWCLFLRVRDSNH